MSEARAVLTGGASLSILPVLHLHSLVDPKIVTRLLALCRDIASFIWPLSGLSLLKCTLSNSTFYTSPFPEPPHSSPAIPPPTIKAVLPTPPACTATTRKRSLLGKWGIRPLADISSTISYIARYTAGRRLYYLYCTVSYTAQCSNYSKAIVLARYSSCNGFPIGKAYL